MGANRLGAPREHLKEEVGRVVERRAREAGGGEPAGRLLLGVRDRPLVADGAAVQQEQPIKHVEGCGGRLVDGGHHRHRLGQGAEEADEGHRGDRVESGGRLIEQQQRWPAGELQRDGQPPLLPAADTLLPFWVADEDIAALGEAKLSQELLAPRSPIGRRRGAAHLEEARLRQRLVHRQRRREQVVLRHKGCEAPHGAAVIRGTVHADCAAGRNRHARERVEERGLPRAARPHDGHELSGAERTRYRVQDQLPALPFRAHFDADAGKGEADRPGRSLGNRRRLDIAHPSTDRR
mmetsp:Transcript_6792/g.20442  ORF Transcript_6792/g.20442 Transcript_6792/m.20442 type:complete len:294 (-) Transcript_6792:1-882(-)